MANQEQLEILKQGTNVWNKWRTKHKHARIDLSEADLKGMNLSFVDLSDTYLVNANLGEANLSLARLMNTDLSGANLGQANLSGAAIDTADLSHAVLVSANLTQSSLRKTNLSYTNLTGARFSESLMSLTLLISINLSEIADIETVRHLTQSVLDYKTIQNFEGRVPQKFLRGCGLSDWEIESAKLYNPDLGNEEINKVLYKMYDLRATQALQISPLFISYSHGDSEFVNKLESQLNAKGIRFWRDIHDAKAGRLETQIDRAMRLNPTVLLILSENSSASDWVEHEVRTARTLEKELKRDVLCPVALDDSWKNSPWSKRIMEQVMEYNILDFSAWKDDSQFENIFKKLIDGLGLFYK